MERKEVRETGAKKVFVDDGVKETGTGVPAIFLFTLEHSCCTSI